MFILCVCGNNLRVRRINLPLVLDTLFAALCAFLLFFTALRFYTKNVALALTFGIAACLVFGALCFLYISKRQSKTFILSKDEKERKLLALHLSLSSDDTAINLIAKSLGENAKKRGKTVICDDKLNFFIFKMQPVSEDDIAAMIKRRWDGKKILYCVNSSPEAELLAKNFDIEINTIEEVYGLLKEHDLLPEKYIYEDPPKVKFFAKVKARFTRKLCAPLFWSGFALLALSFITFFPLYYIISGSLMIILSLAALIFGARG